jgi:hypothetical protein
MRRAYWTADFAEANIVAGLLRANGIDASVFDTGMAQLNWMETLAIGGYRIMVADADAETARKLIADYRKGEMELPDEDVDQPTCPNCGARKNGENQNPRRVAFGWVIFPDIFALPVLLAFAFISPLLLYFALAFVFPVFLLHWMKRRYRCTACANTWQAKISEFETLSHAVDAAEAANAQPK